MTVVIFKLRTKDEILARLKDPAFQARDFFGFQRSDLLSYLPFEDAAIFLRFEDNPFNPRSFDSVKVRWKIDRYTVENILNTIVDYMPFAWEEANECRGLSASRSIDHFNAWLWLLNDPLADTIDEYNYYGKNKLALICHKLKIPWRVNDPIRPLDNGYWFQNDTSQIEYPIPTDEQLDQEISNANKR